ncbi:MAG: hypothetical protein QME49_05300 [bacterium]|nr:hypothetical protein [bacterium]
MTIQNISIIIAMVGGFVGIIGGTIGVLLVWIKYENRLTTLEVDIKSVKDLYGKLEQRHYEMLLHNEMLLHKIYEDKSSTTSALKYDKTNREKR